MKKYRLTQLINKPEHRLKAIMRKFLFNIRRLDTIKKEFHDFNIPMNVISENDIKDKIKHYYREYGKVNEFRNWKFNDKYMGDLSWRYYRFHPESLELVNELNKKKK